MRNIMRIHTSIIQKMKIFQKLYGKINNNHKNREKEREFREEFQKKFPSCQKLLHISLI